MRINQVIVGCGGGGDCGNSGDFVTTTKYRVYTGHQANFMGSTIENEGILHTCAYCCIHQNIQNISTEKYLIEPDSTWLSILQSRR